jgi:2-dehydropantoate 2-reductase
MGGVWAAHLTGAGHEVTLVDTSPAVVAALQADGLILASPDGAPSGAQRALRIGASERAADVGPVDVVFFFVKAHHTPGAAAGAGALVGPQTVVVTQQNGWGNADVLAGVFPPQRLVVGVTYHSARVEGPGKVAHTARGPSFVGPYLDGGDHAPSREVAALLEGAGLETVATEQVKTEIWKKLILNTATLPTSTLTRLRTGPLGQPGPLLDLVDGLARESVAVAQGLGYEIGAEERLERIHATLAGGGAGKSSMLQDVEAGRKTEVEVVNGAVVRAGAGLGLPVPLNQAMLGLVLGLERGYLDQPGPAKESGAGGGGRGVGPQAGAPGGGR